MRIGSRADAIARGAVGGLAALVWTVAGGYVLAVLLGVIGMGLYATTVLLWMPVAAVIGAVVGARQSWSRLAVVLLVGILATLGAIELFKFGLAQGW